jgi:hypothetical protein
MYNGKTRSSRADKFDRIDGGTRARPEAGRVLVPDRRAACVVDGMV